MTFSYQIPLWTAANDPKMHRGKMQVLLRDWDPGRTPHGEMLQEDEAELNVMDFVETEYKLELSDEAKLSKRKFPKERKSKSRKCWEVNVEKVSDSPKGTKVKNNKKKLRTTQKLPSLARSYTDSEYSVVYPYASCLKNLCNKVGKHQDPVSDSLSTRLFSQLQHLEVHYPYAALLKELHLTAQADNTKIPSTHPGMNCKEQGAADVMKSLNYQTGVKSKILKEGYDNPMDVETPYSAILLAFATQQRKYDSKGNHDSCQRRICELKGIGDILHNSMRKELAEDVPLSELHSSALLHKISLTVQEKGVCGTENIPQCSSNHKTPEQTSTESSQSEVDDLDWKPNRSRRKSANGITNTKKRKAERRKKTSQVKPTSSKLKSMMVLPPESACAKVKNSRNTSELAVPSRLLQLIMGKEQEELKATNKKFSDRNLDIKKSDIKSVTYRDGKLNESKVRGRKAYSRNNKIHIKSEPIAAGEARPGQRNKSNGKKLLRVENKTQKNSQIPLDSDASEQQSLLKEYLLKPAGEEIKTEENCDMPKVETHFLFSRMLQNFKILAEVNNCESISERDQEAQSVPDILRDMLVGGNDDGELQAISEPSRDCQDDKNTIHTVVQHRPQTNLFDRQDLVNKIECDQSVICKIEPEEAFCKVEEEEEEEDSFECQVCHLQFSSGIDLSTHQVLFHCTDDPQASSSHALLSHSVDNMQKNVLQNKLPA